MLSSFFFFNFTKFPQKTNSFYKLNGCVFSFSCKINRVFLNAIPLVPLCVFRPFGCILQMPVLFVSIVYRFFVLSCLIFYRLTSLLISEHIQEQNKSGAQPAQPMQHSESCRQQEEKLKQVTSWVWLVENTICCLVWPTVYCDNKILHSPIADAAYSFGGRSV